MITRSPVKSTKPLLGPPNSRRVPTPLRSTPATTSILSSLTATGSTATPHEAMVASQLAHINDLVQKNRSLEQTVKKLNEDLSQSAADILGLTTQRKSWEGDRKTWTSEYQKWMDERKAWAEGCDTMQACHRIQQYRVASALHDERVAVLKMQELARNEHLKRLQRDYKITMFQAREAELEAQLDQVEELRDEATEVRAQYEKAAQELKARSAALADQVKSKTAEIKAAHKQRQQDEEELLRLREAHADATATSTAISSELARLTTERDALEAQVISLKRSLELAQDGTTQLRTQLADWQNMKKGEDAAAEEVRKKRVELEQELGEAKMRIGELETRAEATSALEAKVQKQKVRIEMLKPVLEEWKAELQEQTTARETAESRLTAAQAQVTTLEQKIIELESQLSAVSKPKPSKKRLPLLEPTQSDDSEELDKLLSLPSTSALPKVKDKSRKPATKSKTTPSSAPSESQPNIRSAGKQPEPIPELGDSDIEVLDSPTVPSAAPERHTKEKGKQKTAQDGGRGSDVEAEGVRKVRQKGKAKEAEKETETRVPAKAKVAKGKKAPSDDDETQPKIKEKDTGKEPTKAKVAKGKKTSPNDDSDEAQPKAKEKSNSRKRTSPEPSKKTKAKPSQPREDSEDNADAARKKKKRKINLFGGSQPSTFDWNTLTQTDEGLGIPTRLSPMKETDVVPRRLGRASKG